MKQVIINGQVVGTFKGQPHGTLRALMIDAALDGKTVEVRDVNP